MPAGDTTFEVEPEFEGSTNQAESVTSNVDEQVVSHEPDASAHDLEPDTETEQTSTEDISVTTEITYKPAVPSITSGDSQQQLKSKAAKKKKLEAAKAAYGAQLTGQWSELVKSLTAARGDTTNGVLLNDAIYIAHRLRGTAGSIGFPSVSEAAGKIEDMLHHLDPTDTLQEIIWTEIFRWLAEGELAVRAASKETEQEVELKQDPLYKKVLLWGHESKYQNFGERRDMQIDVAETLPQVLECLSLDKYSAVFIDLSVADQGETFMGAKEIRALHSGAAACIPLGCVMPAFDVLPEELVYAGFSTVLQNGANEQEIEWACKRLTSIESGVVPRVLTVDDDDVLTSFIATVLGAEGMNVQTLNKPILILEALEKFKPEIILLDVMMPGLSGYDVCRMLRADDKWKNLSIVFLTSKSDQEGRAAAFQAGGDDFLSKPVLAEELLARVNAQHERKHSVLKSAESGLDGTISGADFMRQTTILIGEAAPESLPVSVCLLSIDDYGENCINHGMQAAAQSMKILAQLTRNHFRADVLRGRIGDEGIALAFKGESQATISMALQMMLLDFQEANIESEYAQYPFKCTFSAGVAQFPDNGTTVHKLLSAANQKLITARREGRGVIRYYNADTALTSNK